MINWDRITGADTGSKVAMSVTHVDLVFAGSVNKCHYGSVGSCCMMKVHLILSKPAGRGG